MQPQPDAPVTALQLLAVANLVRDLAARKDVDPSVIADAITTLNTIRAKCT